VPKAKITKSFVDSAPLSKKGQVLYCDKDMPGFYLIIGKSAKTYAAQKDIRGRSVRFTIGRHGHFTPEEARKIARDKLYLMSQGINPNTLKTEEKRKEITLAKVLKNYQDTRKNLKQATKDDYEYHLNKYLSDWMNKLMADIDKDMVIARHSLIGKNHGPSVANGTMRILRALFNHAHASFDICEVNPVAYLSRTKAWYPIRRKQTYIKPHQLKAWWKAVNDLENETQRDYLLFLLLTGLRKSEAAKLKWADIDMLDKTFTIIDTKNSDPLTLPMSDFLFSMFTQRRLRYGNYDYVFPGTGAHGHLIEPKASIYKVAQNSGVTFTCHDLRRTFLTIAESLDISHYALKRLVNHRLSDVTSGYIIANVERLRRPVEQIAQFVLEKVNDRI